MIRRYIAGCVVAVVPAVLLLSGCAATPKPIAMAAPPSPTRIEQIRTSYESAFPNAHVGVVTAVLGGDPYALVGEVDSAGMRVGDVFSFIDASEAVVASGTVRKIDPGSVTVHYAAGLRAPRVGDVAVKF